MGYVLSYTKKIGGTWCAPSPPPINQISTPSYYHMHYDQLRTLSFSYQTAVSADPADALMMHMASTLDEQRRTMTPGMYIAQI